MVDSLKDKAESQFQKKQQERIREGEQARKEYEAGRQADRDKTSRLRGLRLAKEAADRDEATAKKQEKAEKKGTARKKKSSE